MKTTYQDYPTQIEAMRLYSSKSRWNEIVRERKAKSEKIDLKSKSENYFWYVVTPYLMHLVTEISAQKGFLEALSFTDSKIKEFYQKGLQYEAYYSSRIEGARSSLDEALEFIKKKEKYSDDESLQMIKNNHLALSYAVKQIGKPVTHELICKLQLILTENTHRDRPITVGKYRHGPVYIVNQYGEVVYEGPSFKKVPQMMDHFIQWINKEDLINLLIKAAIVHFNFVHIHPFDDGNGRTARALSNLVLAHLGFQFINSLTLSSYFDHKRSYYYKAIQDVRNHDGDLTYFLIFYLEALLAKIKDLKVEINLESKRKSLKDKLSNEVYKKLNRRQIKSLNYMLTKDEMMTTRKHCKLNQCSDETARQDFIELEDYGLIEASGKGRSRSYKLIEITN